LVVKVASLCRPPPANVSCCGVSGVDAVTAVTERTVQGVPTVSGDSSTASPTAAGRKLFRLAVAPALDIASSTLAPDSTREACSTSTRSMPAVRVMRTGEKVSPSQWAVAPTPRFSALHR
jgi:hypothetical protein